MCGTVYYSMLFIMFINVVYYDLTHGSVVEICKCDLLSVAVQVAKYMYMYRY